MNVTLTSLEAYHELIASGRLETYKERVYEAIRIFGGEGGISDKDISRLTHLNENTSRPRRIDLENEGRIISIGLSQEPAGRRKTLWKIR